MQNIKHLLWSLVFTVLLSVPSFAIMGIKAPGPAVEPGNPSKVISATHADTADSSSVLNPLKVSGVPSVNFFYEANSTDTNGIGFIGPTNATKNIFLKLEDETASVGQTLVVSNIAIDQTINTPIGNITADIWTLITGESSAAVSDDAYSSTWDGVTTIGASKNALYDKISALETQVSDMIAAFSAAGLNSFTFTPSVTYPIWASTSPVAISFDVTDTSTTYAVADVDYQYDGAGGFVENMTNTTGNTWTADVTIATDGAHTIQLEAVDDKSPTPNSGQSAIYTINFDGTDPVIGTVTPSALTHDGLGATFTATVGSVTEPNVLNCQWSLYDVTDAAIEIEWTTFTGLSISGITIPADQHTYRLDVRCTDLAGNVGTASSANIEYSTPVSALMYWSADSATVLDTPSDRGITAAGGAGVGTYAGRQAANADGYDRYFTVATPTDLLSTDHFDIEIDVYIPAGSTGGIVFRLEGLSGGEAVQIGVTTTGINCYYATSSNHAYTTTVSTDAWHTIRWRFDTATNSSVVSLDATDDTTTITENMTTSYTGMTLGGRSGYNGFDGYFDEVYSHAVD